PLSLDPRDDIVPRDPSLVTVGVGEKGAFEFLMQHPYGMADGVAVPARFSPLVFDGRENGGQSVEGEVGAAAAHKAYLHPRWRVVPHAPAHVRIQGIVRATPRQGDAFLELGRCRIDSCEPDAAGQGAQTVAAKV